MALCWLIAQLRRRKLSHKLYYPTFVVLAFAILIRFARKKIAFCKLRPLTGQDLGSQEKKCRQPKGKRRWDRGQASFIVVIFPGPLQSAINANSKYEKADKLYTFPEPHPLLCLYVTKKFSTFFNLIAS